MARFRGTDKSEFIDNQRVEGNIFVLLNEAMNFFRKHLNMRGRIVGFVRDEYLEVPAEALREAILNALCHRQYERYNLTIGIAIYDDRIEIENPGVLPPQITPENIKKPHGSYPYNPLIANVLYSTDYIENWGSGVKRIMEVCQKRGVTAPVWTVNGGFVVVTFVRDMEIQDVTKDVTQNCMKDCIKELSERQRLILEIIQEDGTITAQKIAQKIAQKKPASQRTIMYDLADLQKRGILHREGGRKDGYWHIDIEQENIE